MSCVFGLPNIQGVVRMWPTDLAPEVALRRQRLLNTASPRKLPCSARWRRGFGIRLVRLGIVVAGPKAFGPLVPSPAGGSPARA
jgi:hypothetical protein